MRFGCLSSTRMAVSVLQDRFELALCDIQLVALLNAAWMGKIKRHRHG